MNYRTLLAVLALTAFGCGNAENADMTLNPAPTGSVGDEEEGSPTMGAAQPGPMGSSGGSGSGAGSGAGSGGGGGSAGGSDYFGCFASGNCTLALANSTTCRTGSDYDTSLIDRNSDVVVLSFHGGLIEPHSTEVADALASKFGWNRYNFSAHGTANCLGGMSDFGRLHITATHFDDPAAVSFVSSHHKAVAIHGYSNSRGNGTGTLCVGGANAAQVQKFIDYVNQNKASFTQYSLQAVNAASGSSGSGANCSGLTGTASSNLVNRVAGGAGGLQLETSDGIKADLSNPSPAYDGLRNVFYGAVAAALK